MKVALYIKNKFKSIDVECNQGEVDGVMNDEDWHRK